MKTQSASKTCRACHERPAIRRGLSVRLCGACLAKPAGQRMKPIRPPIPAYKLTRAVSRHGTTRPAVQKQPPHRDRRLLDLAHELHECMACGAHVEAGLEPAHSNMARHGKGKSMKASDVFFAALCPACHREIDQGSKLSREERQEIWQRAFEKTLLTLFERGWIKVAA